MANVGAVRASSFVVTLNGRDDKSVTELQAGADLCVRIAYQSLFELPGGDPIAVVDSRDEVQEEDESNNELRFPLPELTRCDIICVDVTPRPAPTPLPGQDTEV